MERKAYRSPELVLLGLAEQLVQGGIGHNFESVGHWDWPE